MSACLSHWWEAPHPAVSPSMTWDNEHLQPRTRACWLCGARQWAVYDDATGRYRHVPEWDAVPLPGVRGFVPSGPPKEPTPP